MMKNVYIKVALAVFVFCLMQFLGSVVLTAVLAVTGGVESIEALAGHVGANPVAIALTVMITGVLSCAILTGMKMIRPLESWRDGTLGGKQWMLALPGAVLGIFAIDLLGEKFELPDLMQQDFLAMANNVWGILAIAVVGPVVEELVFREGMQGHMLRSGVPAWRAIIISALCFGIIHFNPAQVPFAFGIGLILGIIYYKTGNVVLTSLIHVLNNSAAVMEMRILGDDINNFSYEEALGGTLASYLYIAVAGTISLFLLHRYWKTA